MISFDAASRLIAEAARPLGRERVPLDRADDRVLAGPVVARHDSPRATVSAMDGYAVRDADVSRAPVQLEILGKSFAGTAYPGALRLGGCVRVFTGAVVPIGTDRVIPQEEVTIEDGKACIHTTPVRSRHLRARGSDFAEGDVLVPAGARLSPQRLVAAAGADLAEVEVVRRPRVLIIACGDELVAPGSNRADVHHVCESVSFGVAALTRRWGGGVVDRWRRPDDLVTLERAAAEAVEQADVVVVTGGASVGERDFAKAMFIPSGMMLLFDKVAMKPGKPVWFGKVGDALILGLPGNPTSALVTARLFLAPLLSGLSGRRPECAWAWQEMPLAGPVASCRERDVFMRATSGQDGAIPLDNQDSAAQKALSDATLLIRRRAGSDRAVTGDLVEAIVL